MSRPALSKPDVPGLAARKVAAKLLGAVVDAHTPLDGLTDNEHGHPNYLALDMRDRSLVRAILATALRFRMTIEALLARRLERPLPANATALSHILHVAAAQMLFLDIPDSAAVDLAVTHAKSDPRTARFAALVNGVLRALGRVKDRALPAALRDTEDAPDWFRGRLVTAYGAEKASRSWPCTGLKRLSTLPSNPIRPVGPGNSAASCCRLARCVSNGWHCRLANCRVLPRGRMVGAGRSRRDARHAVWRHSREASCGPCAARRQTAQLALAEPTSRPSTPRAIVSNG
jgi:hypothetical protein